MTWSIEALNDGQYGLVQTKGQQSRTAFLAFSAGDAADFLVMAETYELISHGVPVEVFNKAATKKKTTARKK